MGLLIGTLVFILLGAVGMLSAGYWAGNQSGLVRILSWVTAFCLWLSYALIYMAQLNPLIRPMRNLKVEGA
jgi:V-type H+-transporting ATPase subunit e